MDAFGLFSSGLFSGYSIIWAGGNVKSAVNGAFLIVTSVYRYLGTTDYVFNGIAVIGNGTQAKVGAIGGNGTDPLDVGGISISYSGSSISIDIGNTGGGWCGFIIA